MIIEDCAFFLQICLFVAYVHHLLRSSILHCRFSIPHNYIWYLHESQTGLVNDPQKKEQTTKRVLCREKIFVYDC
jgi:hypothetical protein